MIIIIIIINCNLVITRWQWLFYMYTNMERKKVTREFKSGGLHERHVVAPWKLGSHLIILVRRGAHIKLIRDTPFPDPHPPFFFLSKLSRKTNPLQVPQRGPLWRELPVSGAFLDICKQLTL